MRFFSAFNTGFNRMIVPHELVPGHYVQLKVAEKAVEAYAQLAQKNNTMIVPGNMSEVAGLIGTAMALMRKPPAGGKDHDQSSS